MKLDLVGLAALGPIGVKLRDFDEIEEPEASADYADLHRFTQEQRVSAIICVICG
jgi:hypothetical protein